MHAGGATCKLSLFPLLSPFNKLLSCVLQDRGGGQEEVLANLALR